MAPKFMMGYHFSEMGKQLRYHFSDKCDCCEKHTIMHMQRQGAVISCSGSNNIGAQQSISLSWFWLLYGFMFVLYSMTTLASRFSHHSCG